MTGAKITYTPINCSNHVANLEEIPGHIVHDIGISATMSPRKYILTSLVCNVNNRTYSFSSRFEHNSEEEAAAGALNAHFTEFPVCNVSK